MRRRLSDLTPRLRLAVAVVAGVVVLNLLLFGADRLAPTPGGPAGSSYATAPRGVAASAEVLERSGRVVRRERAPLDEARLDPRETVVVLEPADVTRAEADALRAFLRRGGRLVAGGALPGRWLDVAVPGTPRWRPAVDPASRTAGPGAAEIPGVRAIRTVGAGAWVDLGPDGGSRPLLQTLAGSPTVIVRRVGRGTALLVADASSLQNRLLDRADNAALALGLAGRGRRVVFAESPHGFARATGLRALPTRWLVGLAGLVLAALVWLVARGRRLGPPSEPDDEPVPPRRAYVDALALLLERTGDRAAATEPVRAAARARALAAVGAPADSADAGARAALLRAGIAPGDAEAVLRDPRDDSDVLAVGRALAAVSQPRGGR